MLSFDVPRDIVRQAVRIRVPVGRDDAFPVDARVPGQYTAVAPEDVPPAAECEPFPILRGRGKSTAMRQFLDQLLSIIALSF